MPRPPSLVAWHSPEAAIIPGLVNLHTHLELTHLRGSNAEPDFYHWIQRLRRDKAQVTAEGFLAAARQGVRDAWAAGTTTVADTGDSGAVSAALTELGGRGVVYQEIFGPHPDQAPAALAGLRASVDRLRAGAGPHVTIGVSPHAPYSVSAPLFSLVAGYAREEGLPLAVHLAESRAETALVTRGEGPFAELWRRRGIPLPIRAASPVAYLDMLGMLAPRTLVIHGVQVTSRDAAVLAERGASVALCPRSNRRHGHGEPPVGVLREAGVGFGVGTDSVVSVETVDLFADARRVAELGGLDAAAALFTMTLGGARALGLGDEIGSLDVGKQADLCLVALSPATGSPDPLHQVLAAGAAAVRSVWVGGRKVWGDPLPRAA